MRQQVLGLLGHLAALDVPRWQESRAVSAAGEGCQCYGQQYSEAGGFFCCYGKYLT